MKKGVILSFISLSLSFAQPKISVVGGDSHDFGEIYKGERVERKVSIENTGDKTLVLNRVQAGCGCTATLLSDKSVDPGKTTALSITFDSHSFSGDVHKNVIVYSNDPFHPSKEIKFRAKVVQVLEANPAYLVFTPGKVDSAMTSYTVLKNLSNKSVEILSVTSDEPLAKFDLQKNKLAPGEPTQLTVTFTPSKLGYVTKDVVVKTSHPKQPEFRMKLISNVRR